MFISFEKLDFVEVRIGFIGVTANLFVCELGKANTRCHASGQLFKGVF